MSCVEVPPAGNQVAITTPVFGAFVTTMFVSPERGLLGTVTQTVCPFDGPQLLSALATTGTTTVASNASGMIPSRFIRWRPLGDG